MRRLKKTRTGASISTSTPLEGLLLVAAGINPNNRDQVQINVIHQGQAWSFMACNAQEARTWLGEDAQRLVHWNPTFREGDDLSGLYRKASFRIPAWVIHWDDIKHLDTVKDRAKLAAMLGCLLPTKYYASESS